MHMNTKNTVEPLHFTDIILESISDGVFTVDQHWHITSFNRAAEQITGIRREEAIGRLCWEVFRSNMCEGDCALKRTMRDGKSFTSSTTHIIDSEQKQIPISVSTSVLKDDTGRRIGGVEVFRDHSLVEELRRELDGRFQFGDIVSQSPLMRELFTNLDKIALSDSTVLIQGETGTGKELIARTIHNLSTRKDEPFVAINCGALPDSLLESELFGYRAGAFTDAHVDKPGLFESAGTGTILLDELGDTSPAFQVRLLRVLEEREFLPLGATRKVKTNARVLAATNRDLRSMIQTAEFRQDLYYRINIVSLELPPLRERVEDIPLLVDRFIKKMNRLKGKLISGVTPEVLTMLLGHDYPGNIRELENIIEHGFILCPEGSIAARHLPAYLSCRPPESVMQETMHARLAETERDAILTTLKKCHYNRTAAAADLGMHKSTLFRKLKKLNISLPEQDGRSSR